MSQRSITSFFNTRKRPASDDIVSSKSKKLLLDRCQDIRKEVASKLCDTSITEPTKLNSDKNVIDVKTETVVQQSSEEQTLEQQKNIPFDKKTNSEEQTLEQQKNVLFHNKEMLEQHKNILFDQKTNSEDQTLEQPKNIIFDQKTNSEDQTLEQQKNVPFDKKNNAFNIPKSRELSTETLASARKELSLGDIRKKLASSSKLEKLKASAERLSKGMQQLTEATDKRNLKEFKSIDLEVPSSPRKSAMLQSELLPPKKEDTHTDHQHRPLISPRKVFVSPVKSPNKIPAYLRHASLATSTNLPLPHHYRFLAELFRGMETVVSLLYNRNEKVTFSKLKPSMQEMLKRDFTEKHLAQIKHLVPDFYKFEVNKVKVFSTSVHKDSYELVIAPNFPNDIRVMNPSVLLERRRYFYDTLYQLVKKHHSQYLASLDPPLVIPDDKLIRWHPEFELEKIPEVESAKLPKIPNVEKPSTAQDVLARARELFKCNTKMERALEKLAQAKSRGLTEEERDVTGLQEPKPSVSAAIITALQTSQPSTSGVTILNPALRNLPTALLEKVKAKQAAKALETMTRSSGTEQKYLLYTRLPDLCRTLRNIFVTERKNVLALNIILSKIESSFKSSISASDIEKDIKALTKEVPEWVKLHVVRNTIYVKLDKNVDLKVITSKLQALADKYKLN